MIYLYLKSIHIIFVVTWFAGLFYMVRLLIYSTEAAKKQTPERTILLRQLMLMQKRLWYIIAWPSLCITLVVGAWLTIETNCWRSPWLHLKLLFVAGLCVYHFVCHRLHRQMTREIFKYSSMQLRVWNEVATLFLFAIVFIVVFKNQLDWIWGVLGLLLSGLLLMLGIRIYKKLRKQ